jgi:hypothetical protein
MKRLISFLSSLVLLIILAGCERRTIQPHAVERQTIAPKQLLETIRANRVGLYKIQPPLTATATKTIVTGWLKDHGDPEEQHQFDVLDISDKAGFWNFWPVTIAQSDGKDGATNLLTFMDRELPSDNDLLNCKLYSDLERLLGKTQGFQDGWGSQFSYGCGFFSISKDGIIHTLSVFAFISRKDGESRTIDSIQVVRSSPKAN